MDNRLMARLRDLGEGKYDFLRLKQVTIFKKERAVEFCFIYPEAFEQKVRERQEFIELIVSKIVTTTLSIRVRLVKSCFFADTFTDELMEFLLAYPSISDAINKNDIQITKDEEKISVAIGLPTLLCDYAKTSGVLEKAKQFFESNYCEVFFLEFRENNEETLGTSIQSFAERSEQGGSYLEKEGGRLITVDNREEFIGPIIYEDAGYISDAKPSEKSIFCGKIDGFAIIPRKPKPPEETTDKKFYKFRLRDFTGSISCLYFPTQKTENIILGLCDGKSVIVSGRVVLDNYNNSSQLVMTVRNFTLCTLPEDFKENRIMQRVNDQYIAVEPKPYIKPVQTSLFEIKEHIPPSLSGKKFCVFDLETTGLDPENNQIMEIGAAIVDDGVIRETFSSFVSISGTVPEKIIQITGITDSDLVGMPCVKDVLMDFYKFSYGLPLVGQNVGFDYGFISAHGAKHHIHFDNERIDTITLARKYLKNMKNFTLKSIAEKLDVTNEGAHRALTDAIATAEVFIKLSKMS